MKWLMFSSQQFHINCALKFGCLSLARFATKADVPVRVRFAPSPTGYLHLGGLRTALYNYLFARSQNGSFILRIEDTDQTRLIPGAVESLSEMLQWTGISIDEGPTQGGSHGPYVQSERLSIYKGKVQQLLQDGTAYQCFCSAKRLELLRKEALASGETPKYDNRCRHLSAADVRARLEHGEKHVIRFKLQPYTKPWQDLVYGPIVYDVASIEGDPVVIKSDGYPTYHFANVVDDHMMGVTHVLRGVEWQASTTKHILLYHAFDWQPPMFAHLPLLLNKDGKKLSKRQNDLHVGHYKKLGYFPEAVLNMLTNMGSGFNVRETAGMTMEDLISNFNLGKVNTNSTRIDFDRLSTLNRLHLQRIMKDPGSKSLLIADIGRSIETHAAESQLIVDELTDDRLSRLLEISQDRISLLTDFLSAEYQYAWLAPGPFDVRKQPKNSAATADILTRTISALSSLAKGSDFDRTHLMATLSSVVRAGSWANELYMKTIRLTLSLPPVGPPVVDVMTVLGKEEVLTRLNRSLNAVNSN